jgi:hypothetical protein
MPWKTVNGLGTFGALVRKAKPLPEWPPERCRRVSAAPNTPRPGARLKTVDPKKDEQNCRTLRSGTYGTAGTGSERQGLAPQVSAPVKRPPDRPSPARGPTTRSLRSSFGAWKIRGRSRWQRVARLDWNRSPRLNGEIQTHLFSSWSLAN